MTSPGGSWGPDLPVKLRHALDFPPPARNPFVHVLAFGALGAGVGILLGNRAPGSTEAVLPEPLLYMWALGLIGFWGLMVIAALWRDVVTGVLIEGLGCAVAVLATGAYAVGALTQLGWEFFTLPVLTTSLYGPAAAIRLVQIFRAANRVHRVLTEQPCPPGG